LIELLQPAEYSGYSIELLTTLRDVVADTAPHVSRLADVDHHVAAMEEIDARSRK